jgi:hypothetical protein
MNGNNLVMRISIWFTVVVAAITLGAVLVAGQAVLQPNAPLITQAGFSLETITPNADGDTDVTEFSYSLSRNARVSLLLESEEGTQYFFRKDESRIPNTYRVLFSGVVDGYTLPDDKIDGDVLRRLVPDGRYTWRLRAVSESGETDERTGTLVVERGNSPLPEMLNFTVSPNIFSPNQDGIDDRTQMNVYLPKPAELTIYLLGPDGQQIFVPETNSDRKLGEAGRHYFDYDGGIDLGVEPPPDGTYTVIAEAHDLEGQVVQQQTTLTIQTSGDPQAEIAPQPIGVDVIFDVQPYDERYFTSAAQNGDLISEPNVTQDLGFEAITMPLNDMLVFKLTVANYGKVPIRTSGPWPGTVYQQDQVWGAMGIYEQSGSWRVGIQCSTNSTSWPWRWAVGSPDTLVTEKSADGNTYYYLPAGANSIVWGAVRMTDLIKARNPQQCWAGLIHEDVEVSIRNSRVGARDITLVDLSASPGE